MTWDPGNPLTGEKPTIKDLKGHTSLSPREAGRGSG